MLERLDHLPADVLGLRAVGRISRQDYDDVVRPALEAARHEGRHVRVLFEFGQTFEGFTPAAAWEDFRVGLRYLRLFERCAVVTDIEWLRAATKTAGLLMPCPVRVFASDDEAVAVDWLTAGGDQTLTWRLLPARGVLVVEPHGPLRREDFDHLAAAADAWMEDAGGPLNGLVVHADAFPGWEDFGSMLRHIRFVRDHHRRIKRVAWAVDSRLAAVAPSLVDHFVAADIRTFPADDVDAAVDWASGKRRRAARRSTPRTQETTHDAAITGT